MKLYATCYSECGILGEMDEDVVKKCKVFSNKYLANNQLKTWMAETISGCGTNIVYIKFDEDKGYVKIAQDIVVITITVCETEFEMKGN